MSRTTRCPARSRLQGFTGLASRVWVKQAPGPPKSARTHGKGIWGPRASAGPDIREPVPHPYPTHQPHRIRSLSGMFLEPPCLCTFARAIPNTSLGWEPPLLPSLRKHLPYSIGSTRGPRGWGHWSACAPDPPALHLPQSISQRPWPPKAHLGTSKPHQVPELLVSEGPSTRARESGCCPQVTRSVTHCATAIRPSGLTISICTMGPLGQSPQHREELSRWEPGGTGGGGRTLAAGLGLPGARLGRHCSQAQPGWPDEARGPTTTSAGRRSWAGEGGHNGPLSPLVD